MNLDKVSREDWIVGGLALLLAIFLLTLPWFDVSVGPFSVTFSATSSPDGWLGILAFIACLALLADLAVERFSPQTPVPAIGNRTNTRFILAVAAALFVAPKFLFHIHFSLFGWGFYVDVIVTAALVYFAAQVRTPAPMTITRPGGRGDRGGPGSGTPSGPGPGTTTGPGTTSGPSAPPDAGADAPRTTGPAPGAPVPPERGGSAPPPGV